MCVCVCVCVCGKGGEEFHTLLFSFCLLWPCICLAVLECRYCWNTAFIGSNSFTDGPFMFLNHQQVTFSSCINDMNLFFTIFINLNHLSQHTVLTGHRDTMDNSPKTGKLSLASAKSRI